MSKIKKKLRQKLSHGAAPVKGENESMPAFIRRRNAWARAAANHVDEAPPADNNPPINADPNPPNEGSSGALPEATLPEYSPVADQGTIRVDQQETIIRDQYGNPKLNPDGTTQTTKNRPVVTMDLPDTFTPTTATVTPVGTTADGVDSLSNAEVTRLRTLMNNENADLRQRQLAEERLREVGIMTDVKSIDPRTDVNQQTIDAPTAPTSTVTNIAQAGQQPDYDVSSFDAAMAGTTAPTEGAEGTISRIATADGPTLSERATAATRDAAQEREARSTPAATVIEDDRSQIQRVTGARTAIDATAEAVAQTRSMVATDSAPQGEAAKIETMYNIQEVQRRKEAQKNVQRQFKEQGVPDDVAAQLAEDPENLAQELERLEDDEIKTTLSGLPREALITTQLDSLLQGMEEGQVPKWARPALAAVERNLAKRGLEASSVGRDALFNAIIQSAIPLAQSNAQAIQAATSQDKSIAAQFLIKNADFQQDMEKANLSLDQQMRLANLTALNQADRDNLNAAQQTELSNLQMRLNVNLTAAKIASSMDQAQLAVDQQRAVQNAMTVAKIDLSNFSAEQQMQLTNSKFMQTATLQDFSARQQAAMSNATNIARMDMQTASQNMQLAIANAQNFLKMDLSNLSNDQQAIILDQQMAQQRLLSDQSAENAARQFKAVSENQRNQFMTKLAQEVEVYNTTQTNAMRQFNAEQTNRISAINANNQLAANQAEAQLNAQIDQFNAKIDFQRDQWNAANAQAVAQSNIEWRRKANTIDTAAQNAANSQAAQYQFQIDSAEQNFIWQALRDEAAYARTSYENDQQRRTTLYATALANESGAGKDGQTTSALMTLAEQFFGRI